MDMAGQFKMENNEPTCKKLLGSDERYSGRRPISPKQNPYKENSDIQSSRILATNKERASQV